MLDVLIKGGTIVDGSGQPARKGDIGIRDGRIAAIGTISEAARETIDATGKIVSPGFVDVHTHYDAQVFWDGTLSPSPYHGVTTVVGGNCGFSIAPLTPDAGPYLMRMLSRVEGMPLESLEKGVPWNWRSFGEYLDLLEDKLSVNAGFMVGHSAIRRVVMGERAVGHEATPAELAKMMKLLRDSLAEGGFGFSSTISSTHNDADGNPVPSRHASKEEMLTLARQCRDFEGTTLEFLPGVGWGEKEANYMADMSLAANRPVNWNVLVPNSAEHRPCRGAADGDRHRARPRRRGAGADGAPADDDPDQSPRGLRLRRDLQLGAALPDADRRADRDLRIPANRKQLLEDSQNPASPMAMLARWELFTVDQVQSPKQKKFRGRKIGEIAKELGKTPFDTLLDLALADGLLTYFMPPTMGEDDASWAMRAKLWKDDRTIIGASDAGAHLDMIDTFAFSTQVLGEGVRKRKLISVEEAVHQLTEVPAKLYGLRERGRLEVGWHADVVVFDLETVGLGETYTKFDLPGGAGRLYADAKGIDHVFANGVEIVSHGKDTGARPGTVLRSGRHTRTVEVPGGRAA